MKYDIKATKKIIVVGAGGSGKDYLCDYLSSIGLKRGLLNTDRPPSRKTDKDGITHYFITSKEFDYLVNNNLFQEYESYIIDSNTIYRYGITHETFNNSDFSTKTPITIKSILNRRDELYIIYLNIDEYTRRKRLNDRVGMADNSERRIAADNIDFANFIDYDYIITDPYYSVSELHEHLLNINVFEQTGKNS